MTLIVYTPLLGGISVLRHQALLDSCVEKDAKIEVISEDKPIYLIRNYYSYYWMILKYLKNAGFELSKYEFNNSIIVCSTEIEKNDVICDPSKLQILDDFCKNHKWPSNLVYLFREFLSKNTGINIKLSN